MAFDLDYKHYGERSILIEWPLIIDKKVLFDLLSFKSRILDNNIESIVNINSAYSSLLVFYKNILYDFNEEVRILKSVYNQNKITTQLIFKKWKIPVCYDDKFGIDLELISSSKNISKTSIINHHAKVNYTVYFIGFLPGFLYLGGLEKELHFPRKETPRLKIEKGAVAIGGNQTGIYPNESPGGWNIIGNTPISFFNKTSENPCFAKPGDQIKFIPVSLGEYNKIKSLVEAGVYQMESEVVNG